MDVKLKVRHCWLVYLVRLDTVTQLLTKIVDTVRALYQKQTVPSENAELFLKKYCQVRQCVETCSRPTGVFKQGADVIIHGLLCSRFLGMHSCRWGIPDTEEKTCWQKDVKLLLLCSELHTGCKSPLGTDISVLFIALLLSKGEQVNLLQLTDELLCSHSVSKTGILGCFFLNVRIMWNPWNDHMNYVRSSEFHDAILLYCKRAYLHPSFAWTKQHGHADTFFFYIWGEMWMLLWKSW